MKSILRSAVAALVITTVIVRAAPPTKEMLDTLNKVARQVNAGNADALEQLRTIPKDTSFHPLFRYVLENRWQHDKPEALKIAKKAAQIIVETPRYTDYFTELFSKDNLKFEKNPNFGRLRLMAIETLGYINNRDAIRILCESMESPASSFFTAELAKMNTPGAPFTSKQ